MSTSHEYDFLFQYVFEFLKSPHWTTPINNFIDEHCAFFEATEENQHCHKEIHENFIAIVEALLEEHLERIGVSDEQFAQAIAKASDNRMEREIIVHIEAVDDFFRFREVMARRNRELNEFALRGLASQSPSRLAHQVGVATMPTDGIAQLSEAEQLQLAMQISQQEAKLAMEDASKLRGLTTVRAPEPVILTSQTANSTTPAKRSEGDIDSNTNVTDDDDSTLDFSVDDDTVPEQSENPVTTAEPVAVSSQFKFNSVIPSSSSDATGSFSSKFNSTPMSSTIKLKPVALAPITSTASRSLPPIQSRLPDGAARELFGLPKLSLDAKYAGGSHTGSHPLANTSTHGDAKAHSTATSSSGDTSAVQLSQELLERQQFLKQQRNVLLTKRNQQRQEKLHLAQQSLGVEVKDDHKIKKSHHSKHKHTKRKHKSRSHKDKDKAADKAAGPSNSGVGATASLVAKLKQIEQNRIDHDVGDTTSWR
jgi:The ARF-like 2 binding protein BART